MGLFNKNMTEFQLSVKFRLKTEIRRKYESTLLVKKKVSIKIKNQEL